MSDALRILHGEFGRAMLVRADRSLAEHAHRTCQLLFKVDGPDVEVVVGRTRCTLETGNVVLLNALELHSCDMLQEAPPVTLLGLHIEPSWLKAYDSRLSYASVHPSFFRQPCGAVPNEVRDTVRQLSELIVFEAEPDTNEVGELILKIILALTAHYSDIKTLSNFETVGGMRCDSRIRKVLGVMRNMEEKRIDLEEMAKIAGMSRPHFFHLFKRETRLTPMGFFSVVRMDTAFKQISETKNSLLDISLQLGFESPGNFTRFFNMQNGISPSQYRRNVTFMENQ